MVIVCILVTNDVHKRLPAYQRVCRQGFSSQSFKLTLELLLGIIFVSINQG